MRVTPDCRGLVAHYCNKEQVTTYAVPCRFPDVRACKSNGVEGQLETANVGCSQRMMVTVEALQHVSLPRNPSSRKPRRGFVAANKGAGPRRFVTLAPAMRVTLETPIPRRQHSDDGVIAGKLDDCSATSNRVRDREIASALYRLLIRGFAIVIADPCAIKDSISISRV